MTSAFSFDDLPISCHAWNPDGTLLAISQNSNEIQILARNADDEAEPFKLLHTLVEHTGKVLSLAWSRSTDRLISGGADRNAFVWTLEEGGAGSNDAAPEGGAGVVWKPRLVILRLKRAATSVKWSPLENKFACGSGDKMVAICYYDADQDFWVSKHAKKNVTSTVGCVDWHPNNVLVATGSSDFRVRVFSGWVREIEDRPAPTPWGNRMPFGEEMASFACGGWVHHVAFSPSGNRLLWVGHDCSISVVDASVSLTTVKRILTDDLPFLQCLWLSESCFVVAGHDNVPVVYQFDGEISATGSKLDAESSNEEETSGAGKARNIFKQQERTGLAMGETASTQLNTLHQNTITGMLSIGEGKELSTTGKDGQLVLWNLPTLEDKIEGLKIQ